MTDSQRYFLVYVVWACQRGHQNSRKKESDPLHQAGLNESLCLQRKSCNPLVCRAEKLSKTALQGHDTI